METTDMPTLYRKRLIPLETLPLTADQLLYRDAHTLITYWKTIRPKATLAYGYSCYLLDRGIKISRFYNHEHQFLHWYCDIISTDYSLSTDTYCFTDLLIDVIIDPDGAMHVLDLDELIEARKQQLLTESQLLGALQKLHLLLKAIDSGEINSWLSHLLPLLPEGGKEPLKGFLLHHKPLSH